MNLASMRSWDNWLLIYGIIGVLILVLACFFNPLIGIAETFVIYALHNIINKRGECDKNNGKMIDQSKEIGNMHKTQEILAFEARREIESERQENETE